MTCTKCRRATPLRHVWVSTEYDGAAKELVQRLKFGRAVAAAEQIAAHLHDSLPYLPENTIVVPVPTSSARVRQRGYDQAVLIAREFAKLRGLSCEGLLTRQGQTRQLGARRQQRLKQLEGAYRIPYLKTAYVSGKDVLLVDDITTTGATLEQAALILRKAGVCSISAAVFARK